MKKFSYFLLALFFFCFGVVMPGCSQGKTGEAPEVSAGTWINADSFKLADHKDKIVVVEFWATWCPPCRKSIPHLKTLYHDYKDKGVVVVSLSNEPVATINEFNKKAGMDWIVGAESESGAAYGVSGIPSAFIVVDGKIVWNGHPMDGLDVEIKKLVEARGGSVDEGAKTPAPVVEPVSEPVVGSVVEPVSAPVDIVPAGDEDKILGDDILVDEVVLPEGGDALIEKPAAESSGTADIVTDEGLEKLGE
ncbi:MAG: TlpA family protein disulfide reductase [Candidatus Riflebacteria bacterium]|nr:TlpA family protein disulfide reductase [Candidatus Riflebacteria bacterium]